MPPKKKTGVKATTAVKPKEGTERRKTQGKAERTANREETLAEVRSNKGPTQTPAEILKQREALCVAAADMQKLLSTTSSPTPKQAQAASAAVAAKVAHWKAKAETTATKGLDWYEKVNELVDALVFEYLKDHPRVVAGIIKFLQEMLTWITKHLWWLLPSTIVETIGSIVLNIVRYQQRVTNAAADANARDAQLKTDITLTYTLFDGKATLNEWMTALPPDVKANTPLTQLRIPGSHDSATCQLHFPTSECQDLSITEQLRCGVRYLDLYIRRIGDTFYACHGPAPPVLPQQDWSKTSKATTAKRESILAITTAEDCLINIPGIFIGQRYFTKGAEVGIINEIADFMTPGRGGPAPGGLANAGKDDVLILYLGHFEFFHYFETYRGQLCESLLDVLKDHLIPPPPAENATPDDLTLDSIAKERKAKNTPYNIIAMVDDGYFFSEKENPDFYRQARQYFWNITPNTESRKAFFHDMYGDQGKAPHTLSEAINDFTTNVEKLNNPTTNSAFNGRFVCMQSQITPPHDLASVGDDLRPMAIGKTPSPHLKMKAVSATDPTKGPINFWLSQEIGTNAAFAKPQRVNITLNDFITPDFTHAVVSSNVTTAAPATAGKTKKK